MSEDGARHNQAGQRKAIRDLLDRGTSRAQSGRSDIRATEVVHNDTNDDVDDSDDSLADHQRTGVKTGLSHLRGDGEEAGGASIGEDEGGDGCNGVLEGGGVGDLVIRDPDAAISCVRCINGLVLEADGDGDGED